MLENEYLNTYIEKYCNRIRWTTNYSQAREFDKNMINNGLRSKISA